MKQASAVALLVCLLVTCPAWSQPPRGEVPFEVPAQESVKSQAAGDIYLSSLTMQDRPIVASLMSSSRIKQQAVDAVAKEVLQEKADDLARVTITVKSSPTCIPVYVESCDVRIPADKVLEKFVDLIRGELTELDDRRRLLTDLAGRRRDVDRLTAEFAEGQRSLVLSAKQQGVDLNPDVAAKKQLQVETEHQRLFVEHEGLVARRKILEAQLLQAAKNAEQAAAETSPVVEELRKSIEARRKIVEFHQAQFNVNNATVEGLEEAKDELAKAELELAKYRQSVAASAGKDRIDELQRRLDDTVVELVENDARTAALEKLAAASAYSTQVEEQRRSVELKEQELVAAQQELARIRLELQQYRAPEMKLIKTQ